MNKELNNYRFVDVCKYIAAIMIVCIHCERLFDYPYLDFFIRQIVCRMAVPFFFVSSAYFIRKGCSKNKHYLKEYLKKLTKSYLLWSLIFMPIGLNWIQQNLSISEELLPVALVFGLVHIGTYYHLWYIPAMIFSLFTIDRLLKRISYKWLFAISISLFLFGSVETYYGFLQNGWFKDMFDLIISVIYTTRSGLLYGMIFVTIGFAIYDYQEKLSYMIPKIPKLTIAFGILLILEGTLIYFVPGLDMNFLIVLIPFSFFFFLWVLSFPYSPRFDTHHLRELSKYYYFVHPVCIVIIEEIGKAFNLPYLSTGLLSLALIFIMTQLISTFVISIHRGSLKRRTIFYAIFFGMFITSILAGLFYEMKSPDILIKFEWVSCICFVISFSVCYILSLFMNQKDNKLSHLHESSR
ncbi:acyltransferase [Anaerorhabdus sp.]|uniref:acyltransferase n=1 Tax=Anaerorhabdus sp. TaxID=1872524 RepID=UPI002B2204B9|nr:acyltransferase [Anaerorhabdus sp.]MEA4875675.1 acyltransferase [Anaerorhabdus sp.]